MTVQIKGLPQQSTIDASDKFPLQDGVSDETKYAEFGDMVTAVGDQFPWTAVPALKAYRQTSIQVLGTGAPVAIQFNAESYKNAAGMHDNSTNPDRLIATKAGIYAFTYSLNQSSGYAGGRVIITYERKNSGGTIQESNELFDDTVAGSEPSNTVSFCTKMAVGDYVQIYVHCVANTGGASYAAGTVLPNSVTMTYVADD
jgi:hypothetical protein